MINVSTRLFILSSLFTAMTMFGAQVKIPFLFVPLTLQTFFVLLSGLLLGPVYGAASQIVYLVLGFAGLPVFAEGGGAGYLLRPTFGYLLSFPLASFGAGVVVHRHRWRPQGLPFVSSARLIMANLLALVLIFVPGVIYLWLNFNFILGQSLSLARAVQIGFLIFIPGDLLKIAGIVLLYRAVQPHLVSF
jgi:biotin transport system substrate-specific component